MLHRALHDLKGDAILARDGRIGSVEDMFFDDEKWTVRYLVVDTGRWLPGRKALIPRAALAQPAGSADYLRIDLTREQVEHAPGIGADPPISQVLEEAYSRHYSQTFNWSSPYLWGVPRGKQDEKLRAAQRKAKESHLRSCGAIAGYALHATDGDLGRVRDFLVDDEGWTVAGVLVDLHPWWPGKGTIAVPPSGVEAIEWEARSVRVRLSCNELHARAGAVA